MPRANPGSSKVEQFLREQGFVLSYNGSENMWKHPDKQITVSVVSGIWQTCSGGRLARGGMLTDKLKASVQNDL